MKQLLETAFLIIFGLGGGIAVGSGMVAFLVVLDVIPRLAQVSRAFQKTSLFEGAVVTGSVVWTVTDFFSWTSALPPFVTGVIGLFAGCFVGMLAAALTEVLNVLPILTKRLQIGGYMIWLLMALIFGKVLGSLFEWLIY